MRRVGEKTALVRRASPIAGLIAGTAVLRLTQDLALAWTLPVGDFGRVATAMACSALAVAVASLGFVENAIRVVPEGLQGTDRSLVGQFWLSGSFVSGVVPAPIAAVLFSVVSQDASLSETLVAAGVAGATGVVWFQRSVLVGLSRQVTGVSVAAAWPTAVTTFVLLSRPTTAMDALTVVAGFGAGAGVIGFGIVGLHVTRLGWPSWRSWRPIDHLRGREHWEVYAGSAASLTQGQVDLLLISRVLGDANAGIYAAVVRLGMAITLIVQAFGFAFGPEFAVATARGDYRRAFDRLVAVAKAAALVAAPLALVIGMAGNDILSIVNPTYVAPGAVLWSVALSRWVNSATGPVGLFLVATGLTTPFFRINLLSLATTVFMLIAALSIGGLELVAAASAAGVMIQNMAQMRAARNALHIKESPNPPVLDDT